MTERHRQCGVLGIDREQTLGLALDQVHHQLATDDQRLLVRERHGLAGLERGERRGEARRADQPVQDEVGVGLGSQDLGGVGADQELDAFDRTELRLDVAGGGLVGDRDQRREELPDLTDQEILVHAGRGQTNDLEAIRVAADDVQGLGPDGPGGPEDRDRPHGVELTPRPMERCERDVT